VGVFDLPAPLFAVLDHGFGVVASPVVRLIIWGLIGAVISMGAYWLLSPQRRIAEAKARALEARRELDAYDGELSGAWPLMRRMLRAALRQLGLVTAPAVLASLPVIAMLVWLDTAYGYALPAAEAPVAMHTVPNGFEARLAPSHNPAAERQIVVTDQEGRVVERVPMAAPVSTIHKWQWWNFLIGNPAGYLPDQAVLDQIEIDLPERQYLSFGPTWLRAWYVVFFASLLVGSLAIKFAARIE
jgi:hypothetical protein